MRCCDLFFFSAKAPNSSKRFWAGTLPDSAQVLHHRRNLELVGCLVCIVADTGVPPPILIGDTVKLLESGSTIISPLEYTVVAAHGNEFVIADEGEQINVPRDRLLLTIGSSKGILGSQHAGMKSENLALAFQRVGSRICCGRGKPMGAVDFPQLSVFAQCLPYRKHHDSRQSTAQRAQADERR